jgi:PAS domain S-box-containing protein
MEALRAKEHDFQELAATSLDPMRAARDKIAKFRSQLFVALGNATARLQTGQKRLTRLGRSFIEKPRRMMEALRERENKFQGLLAPSLDPIRVANAKVAKFRSQLFVALGNVTVRLETGQKRLTRLGRSFVDKPRRMQKALRSRENDLRNLLASSPDAIVVTNLARSFVSANPKALDLFGVSETNMKKFTVDTFLSGGPIPEFDGNGSPFRRQKTRRGKCEVRRLDGSLQVAEYSLVANFVPFRHLYRFYNVTAVNQFQPATLRALRVPSFARAKHDRAN